jgi:hypothetical protein
MEGKYFIMNTDFRVRHLVADYKVEDGVLWMGGHSEIRDDLGNVTERTETTWNLKATYV